MFEICNADVYYEDIQALQDVSIKVLKNEFIAVIGSNGAGKTTLIKAVCGLLPLRKGSIIFENEDITGLPPHEIAKRGIAVTHEGRRLFPAMTVAENLEMGSYLKRAKKNLADNLKLVYELFPILKERSSQFAGKLSGGEQQMLAIARSLMLDPKFLLIDEASLGLAPILVQKLFSILQKLKEMELTTLLVEQNVPLALSIANKGYVLENGKIILAQKAEELLKSGEIKKKYLGI